MTEDESRRAVDVDDMFAVLPSIDPSWAAADPYGAATAVPLGAYRSDAGEIMDRQMVAEMLRSIPGNEVVR